MESPTALKDCVISARSSLGTELRGNVLRLTRFEIVIDIFSGGVVLQTSEALNDFKILFNDKPVYAGRGIVKQIINMGLTSACEVTLEEAWLDPGGSEGYALSDVREQYRQFLGLWQKGYRILEEFKVIIADIQTYLIEWRSWMEQLALARGSSPSDAFSAEKEVLLRELTPDCLASLDVLFDRFERVMEGMETGDHPIHRNYARRHLHPLLLCAPFVYRTYFKPLGYAGDYEMVNMITRDCYEGESLYAKLVNKWFTNQAPALAHRNRIKHLTQRLIEESVRVSPQRAGLRVLNLGCGPAAEIQAYLRHSELSDRAQFTLYDFNDDTIAHAKSVLDEAKRQGNRRTELKLQKRSVQQIIKEAGKTAEYHPARLYDFVYCAGLFDYLTDSVCQRITSILYHWTAPGGLLLLTNVDQSNPRRHTMESLLEWNLIYRDSAQAKKILPPEIPDDACKIHTEISGVNIVLEIRKP